MVRLLATLILASFCISVWSLTMKMYKARADPPSTGKLPIYLAMQQGHGGRGAEQIETVLLTTYEDGKFTGDTAVYLESNTEFFIRVLAISEEMTFQLCDEPSPKPGHQCSTCGRYTLELRGENPYVMPDRINITCRRGEHNLHLTIGQVCDPGFDGVLCRDKCKCPDCAPSCDTPAPTTSRSHHLSSWNLVIASMILILPL
ncbi:unnamed protein product, partial [Mesorhabditis spiculigera]